MGDLNFQFLFEILFPRTVRAVLFVFLAILQKQFIYRFMIHQTINKGCRTNKEGRKRFIQKYGISAQSFLHHYLKQGKNFRGHPGEAQLPGGTVIE